MSYQQWSVDSLYSTVKAIQWHGHDEKLHEQRLITREHR